MAGEKSPFFFTGKKMYKEMEEHFMLSTHGCVKETDFHITFICLSHVLGMRRLYSGVTGEHS